MNKKPSPTQMQILLQLALPNARIVQGWRYNVERDGKWFNYSTNSAKAVTNTTWVTPLLPHERKMNERGVWVLAPDGEALVEAYWRKQNKDSGEAMTVAEYRAGILEREKREAEERAAKLLDDTLVVTEGVYESVSTSRPPFAQYRLRIGRLPNTHIVVGRYYIDRYSDDDITTYVKTSVIGSAYFNNNTEITDFMRLVIRAHEIATELDSVHTEN